jgi:hypothetical protein
MFKTKEKIEDWLKNYGIRNYSINDDLTVDVIGYINLTNNDLLEIPVQFGIVKGDFFCGQNKLTSLKGTPYHVTGTFDCSENNLANLDDSPKIIGYDLNCSKNPLISLGNFDTQLKRNFIHNSKTHKILELAQHYVQSVTPNGKISTLVLPGIELNSILLSLKLETELSKNIDNKQSKLKI